MLNRAMKVWVALGSLVMAPIYAHAAMADDPPSVAVSYDDLDLTNTAGDKALYNRIRSAAQAVCRSFESRQLSQLAQHHQCLDRATTRAVADVNQPNFSAYYSALFPHKNVSEFSGAPNQGRPLRVSRS
jgi:UrcA family protein